MNRIVAKQRILFTGASSFTGYRFVQQLLASGHEVTATLTRSPESYPDPLRKIRVDGLLSIAASAVVGSLRLVHGVSFGDDAFMSCIHGGEWDVLAHHGADVTDYRSPNFLPDRALSRNTRQLPKVLAALKTAGCRTVLLTGSIFEGGEGVGSSTGFDVSPYGLSKRLTWETFVYYCHGAELALAKFVIPNPFGAYEERRFTAYLVQQWLAGKRPSCSTPEYIRDNIHGSLLARAYVSFMEKTVQPHGPRHFAPSGYVESQGAFALRVARELAPRLQIACPIDLMKQTTRNEPHVLINTARLDAEELQWSEQEAWDEMADYYLRQRKEEYI